MVPGEAIENCMKVDPSGSQTCDSVITWVGEQVQRLTQRGSMGEKSGIGRDRVNINGLTQICYANKSAAPRSFVNSSG